jgi:hypothetical protein
MQLWMNAFTSGGRVWGVRGFAAGIDARTTTMRSATSTAAPAYPLGDTANTVSFAP